METITISLARWLSFSPNAFLYYFSSQVPNQRQPQALWTLKQPLQWIADRHHRKQGNWGHARRQKNERMWYVLSHRLMQLPVALSKRSERRKLCLLSASYLYFSYTLICEAIGVHQVAFMNTLCLPGCTLLIIIETWGQEETLLKIKRSGDV